MLTTLVSLISRAYWRNCYWRPCSASEMRHDRDAQLGHIAARASMRGGRRGVLSALPDAHVSNRCRCCWGEQNVVQTLGVVDRAYFVGSGRLILEERADKLPERESYWDLS